MIQTFITEFRALIDEHIKLIKIDAAENTHKIIKAVISILFALVLGHLGLLFLGLLLIALMSMLIPAWSALLLVTAIYFGVPLVLLVYAINLFHDVFKTPKKSIEELDKTGEEAKIWLQNIKK